MSARRNKRGQVAIFLVLILAGLAMLIALNMDVFTSARAKTRLQNAADASALALARWQAISLNLIGELNLAHLVAVNESNATAMASIVGLQRRIAFIGPTLGLKEANDIARQNGVPTLPRENAVALIAEWADGDYRDILNNVIAGGVYVGVDNADIVHSYDNDFFEAVRHNDFRTLCLRYSGGKHELPPWPEQDEVNEESDNAYFGSIGIKWSSVGSSDIGGLVALANTSELRNPSVSATKLKENIELLTRYQWCVYDDKEWQRLPDDFSFSRFPWLSPLKSLYDVSGGSTTIRIENVVPLSSIAGTTNRIASQAAAKAFGSVNGGRVTDVSPPLVMPCFTCVRLVPFGVGAVRRKGLANPNNVPRPSRPSPYNDALRKKYESSEFRDLAEQWYSQHGHTDADGCRPPTSGGPERGGGTPYGI